MPTQDASRKNSFDRIASAYLASRLPYPDRMMAWLSRHVAARKRGRALDLGCGPGMLTLPLCRVFRRVFAADLSVGMLAVLRNASRGQIQRPITVAARGEALPFKKGTLQLVACSQSLHWMNGGAAISEMHRVLAKDGLLLVCWQDWMAPDSSCEQVYRMGWEEVAGEVPPSPPDHPGMGDPIQRLGRPFQDWSRDVVGNYTPTSLATFFQSRESVGRVDESRQRQLGEAWRELATRHLGARIPYTFQVKACLFTRSQLEDVAAAAGAGD